AVGGLVVFPDFGPNSPDDATDLNDMVRHLGTETVKAAVANAKTPEVLDAQPSPQNAPADDLSGLQVNTHRADTIKPEAVTWLWDGFLAGGKLNIVAGAPGTGKTTLALAIAATLTIGGRWPDGTRAAIGDVLIWSGEDSPGDTLVPRLIATGAD